MSHGIVARYEHRLGHGNEQKHGNKRKLLRSESEGCQCRGQVSKNPLRSGGSTSQTFLISSRQRGERAAIFVTSRHFKSRRASICRWTSDQVRTARFHASRHFMGGANLASPCLAYAITSRTPATSSHACADRRRRRSILMTSMGIIKIILWRLSMHQRKSQVLSMFILAPFICLNFQIEAVPLGARNHPASVVPEYAVPVSEFAAESASQLLCWRTVLNGTCCIAQPDLQRSVKCTSFLNPTKPTTCP